MTTHYKFVTAIIIRWCGFGGGGLNMFLRSCDHHFSVFPSSLKTGTILPEKTKSVNKWQKSGKFRKFQIISIPQNHYNLL